VCVYLIDLVTIHPSDKSRLARPSSFDGTSDTESCEGTMPGRSPRGETLAKGFVEKRPFSTSAMDSRQDVLSGPHGPHQPTMIAPLDMQ